MKYSVPYYCYNCFYEARVYIERGKEALDFICPNCGRVEFKKTRLNYSPDDSYQENVQKRIRQLQTGNPNKITLKYAYKAQDRDEALRIEAKFHAILKRFNKSGEWYQMGWQDAKTLRGMFYAMSYKNNDCWLRIRRKWYKMIRDARYYSGLNPAVDIFALQNQKGKTS